MRRSRRRPRTRRNRRRERRQQRALAVAIAVTLGGGVFGAATVEAADGEAREAAPTFTVACEHGVCTFTAGEHSRTAEHHSYEWDWGDGTSGEGREVSHIFVGDDDSYTVKLKSTDEYTGKAIRERITCVREEYTLVVSSCG